MSERKGNAASGKRGAKGTQGNTLNEPNVTPVASKGFCYSLGSDIYDNIPEQCEAKDFAAFRDAVLELRRPKDKFKTYVCGPLGVDESGKFAGQHHRLAVNALPRSFLPFDLDSFAGQDDKNPITQNPVCRDVWFALREWLTQYQGFAYTTASSTDDLPRARIVLAQSRPTTREEGIRLGKAFEATLPQVLRERIKFDPRVYLAEQELYTPTANAETWCFDGAAIDVDELLKGTPAASPTKKRTVALVKPDDQRSCKKLREVLPLLDADDTATWLSVTNGAGRSTGQAEGPIWDLICEWAAQYTKSKKDGARATVYNYFTASANDHGTPATLETVWKLGRAKGWGDPDADGLCLIRGDQMEPENINWLWNGYLAREKLHLIAGEPGTNKTTVGLAFAATITQGGRWPDGTLAGKADVLIWSGEDGIADTLIPRLMALGADMSHIHFIKDVIENGKPRAFDPSRDMEQLELAALRLDNLALTLVDPVVLAVKGDSHKNTEVRRGLQPLVDFAVTTRSVVLGITHFSKNSSKSGPLDRINGSVAFGAVVRLAFACAASAKRKRVLVRAKSNIGPDGGGFEFEFEEARIHDRAGKEISTITLHWGVPVPGTAKELLDKAARELAPMVDDAGDEGLAWLRSTLAEAGGSMERNALLKAAAAAGFTKSKMDRARERGKISFRVSGFSGEKGSIWSLPKD